MSGGSALLLAFLTRSCAAGPYWWQCGRPAQAATYGVNLRGKGAHPVSTCPADTATPEPMGLFLSRSHLPAALGTNGIPRSLDLRPRTPARRTRD